MSNKKDSTFRVRGYHPLWQNFPGSSARLNLCNFSPNLHIRNIGSHDPSYKTNAVLQVTGLGSFPFARRYSGNRFYFLFLRLLRCFSSARLPPAYAGCISINQYGLPHSDIPGSKLAYSSPRLFAVNRVLHRHTVPRHPPCALSLFPSI